MQGKYFNKIAEDLRKLHKGKMLDQVLNWVMTLHGYCHPHRGRCPTWHRSEGRHRDPT